MHYLKFAESAIFSALPVFVQVSKQTMSSKTPKISLLYNCTLPKINLIAVANPDLELTRWGGGFVLLALLAFLLSVISSFFTQSKGGGPPGPSPRSANEFSTFF